MSPQSPNPEESYRAQVGVATRVSRGTSITSGGGRKASIVTIVPASQVGGHQTTLPPVPALEESTTSGRRPRSSSGGAPTSGHGARTSLSGSESTSATPGNARRGSSVYAQNSVFQPSAGPPSRHTANLITLARRTAHISTVPGYGWRLHLLEKLEVIMGTYLTIHEAEEILCIGNGAEAKATSRVEPRRSQIGLPAPSSRSRHPSKASTKVSGGFFNKARSLFGSHSESSSSGGKDVFTPPRPAPSKVVFGQPLSIVAEYGFVTSMIAGQRHDLPGVCFSTVEEIYRRGQGPKIPGLLHLSGEHSRIAKLVHVYNSAPDYGEHHDLSIESIHNVTSLLKKYLRDLPEPILDQRVWRLYTVACVDSNASMKQRVACAQIILRLLPAPNFSLLVYLVAFLSQMPLFPENSLSLESVSAIFGTAAMAVRRPPPTSAKLTKPTSAAMVISSPTEQDASFTSKKAQDGLLWLLNHWSAIADGLLEPDFDIDTTAVLENYPPVLSVAPIAKAQPRVPTPPSQVSVETTPSSEPTATAPVEILTFPGDQDRAMSPVSPQRASVASSHQTIQTTSSFASVNTGTPHTSHSPSNSFTATFSPDHYKRASSQAEETVVNLEANTREEDVSSPTLDMLDLPAFASPRSSASTLESSSLSSRENKTQSLPLVEEFGKVNSQLSGFARAVPEDEFGPVGPNGASVLDDLLEQDNETSLYNFPSPPNEYSFVPASKNHRDSRPESVTLLRSRGEQLLESQQTQDAQRREIQALWQQLTDNELARTSERSEVECLRQEVASLKATMVDRSKELMAITELQERCEESEASLEVARESLEIVQQELTSVLLDKERGEREASEKITALELQLDSIRSVLGGAFRL